MNLNFVIQIRLQSHRSYILQFQLIPVIHNLKYEMILIHGLRQVLMYNIIVFLQHSLTE